MQITQIKPGMVIECHHGIATVVAIDTHNHTVLIERQDNHGHISVPARDIEGEPRLDSGYDREY
ncbi:hypothetical protein GCM10023333_17700 [Ferrimonas pelagia]|uniref:Malate dehydrogenase n=1 Tax=Ferrimonas pelagia TaxID=1177826 RepID=A0ABP9EQY3_9GAMM